MAELIDRIRKKKRASKDVRFFLLRLLSVGASLFVNVVCLSLLR